MSTAPVWLPVPIVARLLDVDRATITRKVKAGHFASRRREGDGRGIVEINLAGLPIEAQRRYVAEQMKTLPAAERLAALQRLGASEQDTRAIAREARITLKPRTKAQREATDEERAVAHEAFERLPSKTQEIAQGRARALLTLALLDRSLPLMERYTIAAEKTGFSEGSLRRWRRATDNLAPEDWPHALVPSWGASAPPKASISKEAWQYILDEWACTSLPATAPIYRRAAKLAAEHSWVLPSYKSVQRMINAIPREQRAFLREGKEGLDRLLPAQQRDYEGVNIHEIWCSDGHQVDLICEWPDGHVGRPQVVAWQDVRTRKILGWAVDKSETAGLVRRSFSEAVRNSHAFPVKAYLDNGRAYASKEITGGQKTRHRFKVDPEEPYGVLTLSGVEVTWAKPGNGRAKPIERFWQTLTEAARSKAFQGSYTGSGPANKPANFTGRPIPLHVVEAAVKEAIEEKNALPHRGQGMRGESPNAVYGRLMQGNTPVRVPTERQQRLLDLAVSKVKLDKDYGFEVLTNRYWCEALTKLDRTTAFHARYNPDDLGEPVLLYDGLRLVAEVPLQLRGDFLNRDAARDHAKGQADYRKHHSGQAQALVAQDAARRRGATARPSMPSSSSSHRAPVVLAKVVSPVRVGLELPKRDNAEREQSEIESARARGIQLRLEERRRANGGD